MTVVSGDPTPYLSNKWSEPEGARNNLLESVRLKKCPQVKIVFFGPRRIIPSCNLSSLRNAQL